MSVYNKVIAHLRCPHCGAVSDMEIDLFFGRRDLSVYRIGDRYVWEAKGGPARGGRPENGNLLGEGYSQCRVCGKRLLCPSHGARRRHHRGEHRSWAEGLISH